jgi:Lanthionine synthetase C-like protein
LAELWRASEHEPLAAEEWDDVHAAAAIAAIVADAEAAFDGERWPWHPRDGEEDEDPNDVYFGGAGVIWALQQLGSTGWEEAALAFVDRQRARPADAWTIEASYSFGELGIDLVAYRLTGDAGLADRVHELVLANLEDEWNEMLWGAAGSLLAAEAMLAWTGEERWAAAWDELADALEAARDADGLWTQHRLGDWRYFGVGHGFAGNLLALTHRRTVDLDAVLARHALRDGALANWSPGEAARPEQIRVQWCHGAPGIVAGLGHAMDEELALAGGELTWRAGPLAKGSSLCHGTAGNAYAFLVLHERTGDELWLDRARAFAMHAIGQVERQRRELGRGRYSLFTGDIGVALFLRHLLDGDDRFPTLGPFQQ